MNSMRYPKPPPSKGGWKTQNGHFPSKIALFSKKSATKFLCAKTVSGKVVIIGLSIGTKMVGGGRPLLRENLAETDPLLQKRQLPINIRS